MSAAGRSDVVRECVDGHPVSVMPYFMDRHDLTDATADDIAAAHVQDVAVQDRYGVRYVHYWFDFARQHAFCLASGPSAEAVATVHRVTHGLVANRIIQVEEGDVARFMGGIEPHPVGEAYEDTAFRAILFTDLAESTRRDAREADRRRGDGLVSLGGERGGGSRADPVDAACRRGRGRDAARRAHRDRGR